MFSFGDPATMAAAATASSVPTSVQTAFFRGDVNELTAALRQHRHDVAAMSISAQHRLLWTGVALALQPTEVDDKGAFLGESSALGQLRALLAAPPLRRTAMKCSRLRAWPSQLIDSELGRQLSSPLPEETPARVKLDLNMVAVLRELARAGIDVAGGGLLGGITPLNAASLIRLSATATFLVHEAGADVNAEGSGQWPMLSAIVAGSAPTVETLLRLGASPLKVTATMGRSALHAICEVMPDLTELADAPAPTAPPAARGTAADRSAHPAPAPSGAAAAREELARGVEKAIERLVAADRSVLELKDGRGCTVVYAAAGAAPRLLRLLLRLGADPSGAGGGPEELFPLGKAAVAGCIESVEALLAAGAAAPGVLPPGSEGARTVLAAGLSAALGWAGRNSPVPAHDAEHRSGPGSATLARLRRNGFDILRAMLGAGLRDWQTVQGESLAALALGGLHGDFNTGTIPVADEDSVFAILRALHAAGLDIVTVAPADKAPKVALAAAYGSARLIRWYAGEFGVDIEAREAVTGLTPLLQALDKHAFDAANALLDLGARVDVWSSLDPERVWPVQQAAQFDTECVVLPRILAADPQSLVRTSAWSMNALHSAAGLGNNKALRLMLESGLPHLFEAVNAVASTTDADEACPTFDEVCSVAEPLICTPLHTAVAVGNTAGAAMLLRSCARVDIPGTIAGCPGLLTIEAWARRPGACDDRQLKTLIQRRAAEHKRERDRAVGTAAAAAAAARASGGASADGASAEPRAETLTGGSDSAEARAGGSAAAAGATAVRELTAGSGAAISGDGGAKAAKQRAKKAAAKKRKTKGRSGRGAGAARSALGLRNTAEVAEYCDDSASDSGEDGATSGGDAGSSSGAPKTPLLHAGDKPASALQLNLCETQPLPNLCETQTLRADRRVMGEAPVVTALIAPEGDTASATAHASSAAATGATAPSRPDVNTCEVGDSTLAALLADVRSAVPADGCSDVALPPLAAASAAASSDVLEATRSSAHAQATTATNVCEPGS